MKRKGIATIFIICLVVAAAIIVGGVFYYTQPAIAPVTPGSGGGAANQSTTASNPLPASSTVIIPLPQTPSLSPNRGPVGTVVTIHGSSFNAANTIEMNELVNASMRNVASADGKTLRFTIPNTLGPDCKSEMCAQFLLEVTPNPYSITVITSGATQNIGTFTVIAR